MGNSSSSSIHDVHSNETQAYSFSEDPDIEANYQHHGKKNGVRSPSVNSAMSKNTRNASFYIGHPRRKGQLSDHGSRPSSVHRKRKAKNANGRSPFQENGTRSPSSTANNRAANTFGHSPTEDKPQKSKLKFGPRSSSVDDTNNYYQRKLSAPEPYTQPESNNGHVSRSKSVNDTQTYNVQRNNIFGSARNKVHNRPELGNISRSSSAGDIINGSYLSRNASRTSSNAAETISINALNCFIVDMGDQGHVTEQQGWQNIPNTLPGYPVPREAPNKKTDIFNVAKMKAVDDRAKEAPQDLTNSFDDLITYLTSGCSSDVEKVRSIFIWMGSQDTQTLDYSTLSDIETPRGYMKLVNESTISYAAFFAVLCRQADIPCVIVEGYAKGAGYREGATDDDIKHLTNSWNAVYCGGGWRLVFPLWACTKVVGHTIGVYTLVEAKGKAVRERQVPVKGRFISEVDDYYFLTDPEAFIQAAFPLDNRWQLLTRKWDLAKFVNVPYCREVFFEEDVEILSKYSCRIGTVDGVCNIKLTSKDVTGLSLDYELYYNHVETGSDISDTLQLNNFVFLERTNTTWDFQIRFPETGVYKLQIVGGRGNCETEMCSFKITCDYVGDRCTPLPFNPGKVGYGPNADTEAAGIHAISHTSGCVKMFPRREMSFSFKLTKDVQMKTELVHPTIPSSELAQYVTQTQRRGKVDVEVSVPDYGEYALSVHAQQGIDGGYTNVCNYLLALEKRRKEREWQRPDEKRAKANIEWLAGTRGTRNIDELEKEIELCRKLELDDDNGELKAAEDALEYKKIKRGLEQAMQRRHLETLEKAIALAHQSRCRDKLTKELEVAEALSDHIRHLNKISHDVLEMKQSTIAELRSYKMPQEIIVDIMRSTFLVLGEQPAQIANWEDLQVLMGKMGKESMIRRVKTFDTVTVQPDTKYRVERTLEKHTEDDARNASAGAGTFYVWLRNVCRTIDQQLASQQLEEEQYDSHV